MGLDRDLSRRNPDRAAQARRGWRAAPRHHRFYLGRNSRFGYPPSGDLGAQVRLRSKPVNAGLRRWVHKYGLGNPPRGRADEIFAQTERLERAAVAALPDGIYRAGGLPRQRRQLE